MAMIMLGNGREIVMGLNDAIRQARWRSKRNAEVERLRRAAVEQSEQLAAARKEIEIAALERETAVLKKALAHERQQQEAAKVEAANAAAAPLSEIARLKEKNRKLRADLRDMKEWYEEESHRKGAMTFATYGTLMKCLHPDSKPSDAERSEACALLGQWKQGRERARRGVG